MGPEAFEVFAELGGPPSTFGPDGFPITGPMFVPAITRGPWIAVDMRLFALGALSVDSGEMATALAELHARARRYWSGDRTSNFLLELLCGGLVVPDWGS